MAEQKDLPNAYALLEGLNDGKLAIGATFSLASPPGTSYIETTTHALFRPVTSSNPGPYLAFCIFLLMHPSFTASSTNFLTLTALIPAGAFMSPDWVFGHNVRRNLDLGS